VQYAAALFEALNVYGLQYIIDPNSSYVEMADNASALDSLNYPYQTLLYRGGDCDDISILFCSLLETLKIETAFITVPGHIYMAFDIGEREGWKVDGGEGLIAHEGKLWMPLEITIPQEGFYRAWRTGVREWQQAGDEGRIYPMSTSWAVYPPVSVPGAGDRSITLPDAGAVVQAFAEAMKRF
jgi:hypothetical protein